MNGPQALYVNPDCFKYIPDINLSPASLLLHSFYTFKTKYLLYTNDLEPVLLLLSNYLIIL